MNQLVVTTKFDQLLKSFLVTFLGIFLIFIFAQISIPLNPVPITLQTVAVLFIGFTTSSRQAFKITTLYVILGLSGLPIFSNFGFGPSVIFSPKGGYIIGFIPSAYLLALYCEKFKNRNWIAMLLMGAFSSGVIFLFGVVWLSYFVGIKDSIILGFLPFIIPGIIKIFILVPLVKLRNIKI